MPKVSVVIPIYNTEDLLDRTLTSVTRQTLSDIEIICIDDGSKDNALTILQSWQTRDSRIRVIALPENGGVSRARNIGIDNAVSPYIYFLDSDDWIDNDYLEAMFIKAYNTGQDVVVNGNIFIEREAETKALNLNWDIREEGFYPTSAPAASAQKNRPARPAQSGSNRRPARSCASARAAALICRSRWDRDRTPFHREIV